MKSLSFYAFALLYGPGCASAGLAWAPRGLTPERPPTDASSVRIVDIGRPDCEFIVLGSAFGTSLDVLRQTAAAHGGDGVYDYSCAVEAVDHVYFQMAHGSCSGRVFACTGSEKAREDRHS